MSDIAKQLGQRIRDLRMERHMSQEELSFKAGLSPAHLGQIERALKNPTVDTIAKIAVALDVPVAALFSLDAVPVSSQNILIEKINAQLKNMSEDEQKDILRIIRIFRNAPDNFTAGSFPGRMTEPWSWPGTWRLMMSGKCSKISWADSGHRRM